MVSDVVIKITFTEGVVKYHTEIVAMSQLFDSSIIPSVVNYESNVPNTLSWT